MLKRGISLVSPYEDADWIVINTCGFIRDAKEESLDEIFAALEKKESGEIKGVAVFGCLPQRYQQELQENFKDVDILWGVNDLDQLADLIAADERTAYQGKSLFLYNHDHKRIITTTPNITFIKISEGCNMQCSFCVIPRIKSRFRSRSIESIIHEIKGLEARGCCEINLIGQDITTYGWDSYGESRLTNLVKQILKNSKKVNWLRLLYLSPERLSDELIQLVSSCPRIVKYIDLPIQHINNRILRLMRRTFRQRPGRDWN